MTNINTINYRRERAKAANELLETIAVYGRRFFNYRGRHGISKFEVDDRGRIWFIDGCTGEKIYLHYRYWGKGFSEGGTLRALVDALKVFIQIGHPVPQSHFGPWPEWVCGGDLWGYGSDMGTIRQTAARLGVTRSIEKAK
jgi:hypothetical protein